MNDTSVAVRVRLSAAGGLGADDAAPDGEVEDYIYPLGPTAISLQSVSASLQPGPLVWIVAASLLLLTLTVVGLRRREVPQEETSRKQ